MILLAEESRYYREMDKMEKIRAALFLYILVCDIAADKGPCIADRAGVEENLEPRIVADAAGHHNVRSHIKQVIQCETACFKLEDSQEQK
jgi:hypothetical protein